MEAFRHCKGVVGVRGAEFANVLWMEPKSKVIVIDPLTMDTPPIHKPLVKLLGLKYYELQTKEGPRPTLSADRIAEHLMS